MIRNSISGRGNVISFSSENKYCFIRQMFLGTEIVDFIVYFPAFCTTIFNQLIEY